MENTVCSGGFGTASMTVLTILNSISGILTAGGNVLVLMAIFRTPSLRVASNVFIGSLAAADLTIGLVMNPIYAAIVALNITDTTHPLNVAEQYLWIHTVITTTFNLAGMSVERYIAVIHPLHYPRVVTAQRTVIAVVAIWCFSFLFVSARAFINQPRDIETLWIAHSVIAIAIPLCVITVCYFHILKAIRQQRRRIQPQPSISRFEQTINTQSNAKAARTMAIVIVLTILFWTPNIVMTVLNFFAQGECASIQIFKIWVWCASVAFISSAINPLVYPIRIRDFRAAIKRICRLGNCCRNNADENVHTITYLSSSSP